MNHDITDPRREEYFDEFRADMECDPRFHLKDHLPAVTFYVLVAVVMTGWVLS